MERAKPEDLVSVYMGRARNGWRVCHHRGGSILRRIVIGISGASGAVYGVRLIERLAASEGVETHLVVTRPGEKTLHQETGRALQVQQRFVANFVPTLSEEYWNHR